MANKKTLNQKSKDFEELKLFIQSKMSMTANYQPVIIRELITRGGKATKDELALALLQQDQEEMDYWRKILMRWPYDTLHKKHGIIEYHSTSKTFELLYNPTSGDEAAAVIELCETKISKFKKQVIPKKSSTRIKLIEQAKGCCQACGAIASKKAPLDLDHIIPQSKAKNGKVKTLTGEILNVHDESNLQILCAPCNRGKRDQGVFNFKPSEERMTEAVSEILKRAIELGFDENEIIEKARKSLGPE
jgi:hypothetical protein